MEEVVIPNWLRAMDVLVGALSIALCGLVLLGLVTSSIAILILLTIALFMVGFARFARAATVKPKGTSRRVINLVAGLIGVGTASIIIFNIGFPDEYLLALLATAWMIMGLARVSIGIIEKDVQMWARILQIVVGLTTLAFTVLVILNPSAEFSAVLLLILVVVIVNGFARTSRGYVGV